MYVVSSNSDITTNQALNTAVVGRKFVPLIHIRSSEVACGQVHLCEFRGKFSSLDGGSEPAGRLDMKGFRGLEVFWRAQGVQINK